ncbi:biotin--[acetyl-CoA-carboxylase] ligase [soil metagenome]
MLAKAPPFTILDCVESTNNYAMGQVNSELSMDGSAWFAYEQTAGKGRRNKQWKADKGKNITMSIAVNTSSIAVYRQFQISVAIALACTDLFKKYTSVEAKIKWPNDIYLNDRKAGGILIENILKGSVWQWCIIGTGININQQVFDQELNKAISLFMITKKQTDVIEAAKLLQHLVIHRIEKVKGGEGVQQLEEYNRILYKKNEQVKLKKGNITFDTTIKEVNAEGKLITTDVMERSFDFDEIEWIIT